MSWELPHRDPRAVHVNQLIPPSSLLTRNFRAYNAPFIEMIENWIYGSMPDTKDLKPKEGVDKAFALDHISRIVNSSIPIHADKTAACSYLMTLWFDKN